LKEFRKTALTPDVIARAVLYAVSQPDDVDVNEIIVRPTTSAFSLATTIHLFFEVSEQAGAVEWNLCHDAHSLPLL